MSIRHSLGGLLLFAGAALLLWALWPRQEIWDIGKKPLPIPPDLVSHHQPRGFERWEASRNKTARRLTFHVAHYQDESGTRRQTLLPAPGSRSWKEWMRLAELMRQQIEQSAMILTWWDNAQRIDFLTGLATWARQPPTNAFPENQRALWRQLSGGFSDGDGKLAQLADWLVQESEPLGGKTGKVHPGKPVYLLVTSNDLSHVDEIERLTGYKLPLEVRIFPSTGNLHGQISAARAWARGTGGIYLPQSIPGGIAAWRVTQPGSEPLWLRLLPFTYPHPQSTTTIRLVYRSPSGKLILYRVLTKEEGD